MAQQEALDNKGRQGGRWVNERPSSEEFAEWLSANMKLDPALKQEDYIGGVVLIPALDRKAKRVIGFKDGNPLIKEGEELSYVPYAKVETRIHYFWDLLDAHPEWLGVVEAVPLDRLDVRPAVIEESVQTLEDGKKHEHSKYGRPGAIATMVHQLPEGFSVMSVPVGDAYSHFMCCTIRVAIYDREEYREQGAKAVKAVPLRVGRATKQVPLLGSYQTRTWADASALMKAETGALGRALGFAGIFVIPGSGVATAEDMMETMNQGETPTSEAEQAAPAVPEPVRTGAEQAQDEETTLRQRAKDLFTSLSEEHPERAQEFGAWARERKLTGLGDAKGAMLKGVVKKLEKLSEEAAPAEQRKELEAPAGTEPEGSEEAGDGEPSGSAG